jgi:protein-tyrosine phosphatase
MSDEAATGAAEGTGGARLGVLFICMGNICRSPLAEGVFLHLARERGALDRFTVDSAGTGGWHAGERADPRARAVAEAHGIDLPSRARQIDASQDWTRFEHLIVMDRANLEHVLAEGAPAERTRLLRSFDPAYAGDPAAAPEVPDPYWGGDDGFERVMAMVRASCEGLLDQLLGAGGTSR